MLPLECINCSSSWSWRRWIGWAGSWWGGSGERSCHCHLKLSNLQPSQIICQWNMQITCKIPLDKRIFFRCCSSYPPPSPHPPLSHFSLRLLFKRCFNNSALAQPNWQCAGGKINLNGGKPTQNEIITKIYICLLILPGKRGGQGATADYHLLK